MVAAAAVVGVKAVVGVPGVVVPVLLASRSTAAEKGYEWAAAVVVVVVMTTMMAVAVVTTAAPGGHRVGCEFV